jgi:hypothetical protein
MAASGTWPSKDEHSQVRQNNTASCFSFQGRGGGSRPRDGGILAGSGAKAHWQQGPGAALHQAVPAKRSILDQCNL